MITKHIHSTKTHISDLGFCLGEKQVSINGCEFEQEQLTKGSGEEVQRNILWITMINFSVFIDFQYIKIICFPGCARKDCSLFAFARKGLKVKKIKKEDRLVLIQKYWTSKWTSFFPSNTSMQGYMLVQFALCKCYIFLYMQLSSSIHTSVSYGKHKACRLHGTPCFYCSETATNPQGHS